MNNSLLQVLFLLLLSTILLIMIGDGVTTGVTEALIMAKACAAVDMSVIRLLNGR